MSKSTATPKKRAQPKLADKSDERPRIFQLLRNILAAQVPPLTVTAETADRYELSTGKPMEFMGKKRPNIYFGAVMVKGSFVGLYLMHVYIDPGRLDGIAPGLRRLLKGKSCFHIKKLDEILVQEIGHAVEDGIACYRKMGFI